MANGACDLAHELLQVVGFADNLMERMLSTRERFDVRRIRRGEHKGHVATHGARAEVLKESPVLLYGGATS